MKKIYLSGLRFLLFTWLFSIQLFGQNPQNGVTVAGSSTSSGNGANQLAFPKGISVDASGNLFVADATNLRVQKFSPGSEFGETVAPRSQNLKINPADVFVDPGGNLYVSDDLGTRILKYSPGEADGKVIIQSSTVAPEGITFLSPYGMAVDATGNVYFVDNNNSRVLKFPPSSSTIYTAGEVVASSNSVPADYRDVCVDAAGNIYVSDARNDQILKFTPGSSKGVVVIGEYGSGSGPYQLNNPEGVFVDLIGNIYVADRSNHRIQKWAPGETDGITVAGGNGIGRGANQLNNPYSVEVDEAGYVYVSDYGNHRVQKFAPTGGLNYKYYEGSWSTLPDFSTLSPVKNGVTRNTRISERRLGRNDNFAFMWQGYIKIPGAGYYTFETVSDDGSRLYFNTPYSATAIPNVNNEGIHAPNSATGTVYIAQAGVYPITITYFEKDGGEQMETYWTGPGIRRQLIPDTAFTKEPPIITPTAPPGYLNYKYYEGGFDKLPDFSTLTPVKTGTSANFDLGVRRPGVSDSFAVVWEGFINIPIQNYYTFETISDDGSKLYFNDILLVNNDGTHPSQSAEGRIFINSPGRFPIRVEYFEKYGSENLQVFWKTEFVARQLIPDPAFQTNTPPIPANGLNYKLYFGDFDELPDFNKLSPVETGIVPNININVTNRSDYYAFIWQGYIKLPAAGTYTFETISDDGSKVYFNTPYSADGNAVVNNDGLHAAGSVKGDVTVSAAGSYPITITYFEKGSNQVMELYYSGPGISRQLIPDSAFTQIGSPPAPTGGLGYKYYEGDFSTLPDFTVLTPVKTGKSSNVDLSVRTPGREDYYAVLWQGYIYIPSAGLYNFETISDDGSKLYFNSMYDPLAIATVNNDGVHPSVSASGEVNIAAAGWYPITISFFEKYGGEKMEVYWSGPDFPRQIIPDAAFSETVPAGLAPISSLNSIKTNDTSKETFSFDKVYPNPFRESFTIEFYNSSKSNNVQVGIYDMTGRMIYQVKAGNIPTGNVTLRIKPDNKILPGGIYVARLNINGLPSKMVKLLKLK